MILMILDLHSLMFWCWSGVVVNGVVKFSYGGVTRKDGVACSSIIVMECGLHHLEFER